MSEWLTNAVVFASEYFWLFALALFIFLLFFWLYKYNKLTRSINGIIKNMEQKAFESFEIQKEGVGKTAEAFLNKLNESVNGQFKSLGESIERYTAVQLKSQEQMEGFVRELIRGTQYQLNINEATESIVSSISKYHQQIVDINNNFSASIKNIVGLTNSLTEVVNFNNEALKEIKAQRDDIKEQYNNYLESIKSHIEAFGKESSAEMTKIVNMFTEVSGSAITKLHDTIKTSTDIWTEINNAAMTSLDKQLSSLMNINNDISGRMQELNQTLGETAVAFAEAVKTGTKETFNEFDEGLSEITRRLGSTIKEIRDSIEDLPVVIDSLKEAITDK